jgi:hypothetical protein
MTRPIIKLAINVNLISGTSVGAEPDEVFANAIFFSSGNGS